MLTTLELESLLNTGGRGRGGSTPVSSFTTTKQPHIQGGDLLLCAEFASADNNRRLKTRRKYTRFDDLNGSQGDPPTPAAKLPPQPSPLVNTTAPTTIHWRQLARDDTPIIHARDVIPTAPALGDNPPTRPKKVAGGRIRRVKVRRVVAAVSAHSVPVAVMEELMTATRRAQEMSDGVTSLQAQLSRERESYSATLQDQAKQIRRWAETEMRRSGEVSHDTLERVVELHTAFFSEHFMLYNRFVLEHMALLHEHLLGRSAIASRESEAQTVRIMKMRHVEEMESLRGAWSQASGDAATASLALIRVQEQHMSEVATLRADHQGQLLEAFTAISEVEERSAHSKTLLQLQTKEWEGRWQMSVAADVGLSSIYGKFALGLKSDERAYKLVRTELKASAQEWEAKERQMARLLDQSKRDASVARKAEALAREELYTLKYQAEADAGRRDAHARSERIEAERRISHLESKLASAIKGVEPTTLEGGSPHLQVPFPRPSRHDGASPSFMSPEEGTFRKVRQPVASTSPVSPSASSPEDHVRIRSLLEFMKRR